MNSFNVYGYRLKSTDIVATKELTSKASCSTGTCFIKKYMPPPLPYFKVNICHFPLPHFTSIFFRLFVILLLTQLYRYTPEIFLPRYFSLRLSHLNIPTGPPSDILDKNISERSLFYF